jgi:hypothetical protein
MKPSLTPSILLAFLAGLPLAPSASALGWPFESTPDGALVTSHGECRLTLHGGVLSLAPAGAPADSPALELVPVASNPHALTGGRDAVPVRHWSGEQRVTRDAWREVFVRDLWPGVDMVVSSRRDGLKRDLLVEAGVDPGIIRFEVRVSSARARVGDDGLLVVESSDCTFMESAPVAWQPHAGGRTLVEARWRIEDGRIVSIDLAAHDPALPLVIDPTLPRGALFGPTLHEDTAYDAFTLPSAPSGTPRAILVGNANGDVGGFDGFGCDATDVTACNGRPCGMTDAFVAFLEGEHCVNVLYVGGSLGDVLFGASYARYAPERAWLVLAGRTASVDLATRAPYQPRAGQVAGNGVDAFYAFVDAELMSLRVLSYLGGSPDLTLGLVSSDDVATAVALGPERHATLVGMTRTDAIDFVRAWPEHVPRHTPEAGQAFIARIPVEVADLAVAIDAAEELLPRGGLTDVTVRVRNQGTIDAEGVLVRLDVDTDLTVTNAPSCTVESDPLYWRCNISAGRIADNAEVSFVFTVRTPDADGLYEVGATVSTITTDPNLANNQAVRAIRVGGIDYLPTVSPQQPAPVAMDAPVIRDVSAFNLGPEQARARLELTASEPLRVAVGPDVTGCTATACGEGRTCLPLTCDGPLQNRQTPAEDRFRRGISFELIAPDAVKAAEVKAVLTVKTTPLDGKVDAIPKNDTLAVPLVFRHPDIVAVSAAISPPLIPWGGDATLTIVGRDDGPGSTDLLRVSFDPRPFTVPVLPPGCIVEDGRVVCVVTRPEQALPKGQLYSVSLPLTAPQDDEGEGAREVLLNTSWLGLDGDPVPTNNDAQARAWLGAVDVRVEAPSPPPVYRTHIPVPTTWTVRNHSASDADGVVFEATLRHPGGLEVSSASVAGGSNCNVLSATTQVIVSCEVGTVGANATRTVSMDVKALARGDITHDVTLRTTATRVRRTPACPETVAPTRSCRPRSATARCARTRSAVTGRPS